VRVNKHKAHRLNGASVAVFAKILDAGKPTRFRFEAAVRHGIRVYLILHGARWQEADDNAAQVIKAAFWKLRIHRPSWAEGQPQFTHNDGGRVFCANEACQKLIERQSLKALLYCSDECRRRAKTTRFYADHAEECAANAKAARIAARAMGETRVCPWCNREFQALDYTGKKKQRFCSVKCGIRFASSCAASWRKSQSQLKY
jgi:hypothetical protein